MTEKLPIVLFYTGGGHKGFLPGIPARDLTAEEVNQAGGINKLLKTGLYVLPPKESPKPKESK